MITVFVGPTLDLATARDVLDARYLPPVAHGDVVRAVAGGARAIGIIDGYFEWTLSVWHKEILWALSHGTHVVGAASMGALRAAELAPFGMRGVGRIYEQYRDGVLEDDDEVAVAHEPGGGYAVASEALVNIRCTLDKAVREGIVTGSTRRALASVAKSTFYPHRRYADLLAGARRSGLPGDEVAALEAWLPAHRVDQKRADALLLLRALADLSALGTPHQPNFTLRRSRFLDGLLAQAAPDLSDT